MGVKTAGLACWLKSSRLQASVWMVKPPPTWVGGALAVMPVFATIFGAIVSGIIIDALDFFAFFTIMGGMVIAVGVLCLFTLRDAPGLAPTGTHGVFGTSSPLCSIIRSWADTGSCSGCFW